MNNFVIFLLLVFGFFILKGMFSKSELVRGVAFGWLFAIIISIFIICNLIYWSQYTKF